uniref:Uncharacterized protein n=1 Tax=Lepeophtheirus salmonis TaxID=72036 RepID=A0A0K2UAY7_LEPSM
MYVCTTLLRKNWRKEGRELHILLKKSGKRRRRRKKKKKKREEKSYKFLSIVVELYVCR